MNRLLCSAVVVILLAGFAPRDARAQSTATLSGTLLDPSSATIAGVDLSLAPLDSSSGTASFHAQSSPNGHFSFTVPAGRYRLVASHHSFTRREEEYRLAAGETREITLRLELERLAARVVVSAQAEPVVAETVTADFSVVTRAQIEERQAVALTPLLATLPGFSMARNGREGSLSTLFLDGGNSNFTKVLVDGTPVNLPGGFVDFSNLTLDNVDKIEVVHGAESALFGSDAASGVIQIITHRGTTRVPQLTLLGEGGDFSTGHGAAELSGLLKRFDYSAGFAYLGTEGLGTNDRFLNRTISGNFGWRFSESDQLHLSLRNNTSDAGIVGQTLFEPPDTDQHNAQKNFSANLNWEFAAGSHWRHRLAGNEAYFRQLFDNPKSEFCFPFPSFICDFPFTSRNQINRAGFAEQSSYFFRTGAVTAGYQYEVENGRLNTPHFRRNNQAGFLDAHYQPLPRLTLSAGARAEANDSFGTRVVPRAGVAFVPRLGGGSWGATRLRFSFGEGIVEPSLIQSFSPNPFFLGNPNLRPERSRTIYFGIEQTLASGHLRISSNYFDNRFRDVISFGGVTFFNTDLARARGANLAFEASAPHWLTLSGSYTYDDSRVLKSPNASDPAQVAGNRLLRRPAHSGNLNLNAAYRRMTWNLYSYLSGRRADRDFLSNRFVTPCVGPCLTSNPGYARFDLAASYLVRRDVTFFGRIGNLFDRQYQETLGFPTLGRDFRLGMKFTIGGE